jgi:hypothetical protein
VGFEAGGVGACPPVVEYSREVQAKAAEELALLSEGSVIEEMLADYSVMREQAKLCQWHPGSLHGLTRGRHQDAHLV